MPKTWKYLVEEIGNDMPQFNNYLISEFRESKIDRIPEYLSMIFNECVLLLDNQVVYLGYEELTPEERLNYLNSSRLTKGTTLINSSSFKLLRFKFQFEDEIHSLYVNVPYIDNNAIIYEDTKYYPIFPIIERGLYRSKDELRIKVLRAWLKFFRKERVEFATISKKQYFTTTITAKIHQSRRGRLDEKTPLILYHFVIYGFYGTLKKYGFEESDIALVTTPQLHDDYDHIKVRNEVYLRISNDSFEDMYKLRIIGSILEMLKFNKKFEIYNITDSLNYFKATLGRYTNRPNQRAGLYITYAEKFIEMNNTLLDPATIYNLKSIGIDVTNIYDLIFHVFYNIDKWLREHNPVNFYDKKIGTLDQIMGWFCRKVFTNLYKIINNKVGLNSKTMKEFVNASSKKGNWITKSTMFRSNPSMYNDNILIGILLKRFRSLENEEVKLLDNQTSSKDSNIPVSLLKSHFTQLIVESTLSISPSKPITSGNMNPFAQITETGDIIEPEWSDEIKDIYN